MSCVSAGLLRGFHGRDGIARRRRMR